MSRYAADTSVRSEQSRAEIERTLSRYGATGFMYGWTGNQAVIAFEMQALRVRFNLPMPNVADRQFTHTPAKGQLRSVEGQREAYEQAVRQRWRALALVVKAKLEAVESGITTFEEEFLAHIVLPGGRTVGEHTIPAIGDAYAGRPLPPLLPAPERADG